MVKQAKLKIFGRVQGVFFRDYAQEKARELGLTGWVCNMPDGTVEALVQGEEESIEKMIQWCHEGSPSAKIDDIKIKWGPVDENHPTFEVRY